MNYQFERCTKIVRKILGGQESGVKIIWPMQSLDPRTPCASTNGYAIRHPHDRHMAR